MIVFTCPLSLLISLLCVLDTLVDRDRFLFDITSYYTAASRANWAMPAATPNVIPPYSNNVPQLAVVQWESFESNAG